MFHDCATNSNSMNKQSNQHNNKTKLSLKEWTNYHFGWTGFKRGREEERKRGKEEERKRERQRESWEERALMLSWQKNTLYLDVSFLSIRLCPSIESVCVCELNLSSLEIDVCASLSCQEFTSAPFQLCWHCYVSGLAVFVFDFRWNTFVCKIILLSNLLRWDLEATSS